MTAAGVPEPDAGPEHRPRSSSETSGEGSARSPARRPRLFGTGLVVAALLVLVVPMLAIVLVLRATAPTTYTFTVPAGTGARQDRGEQVELMPPELNLEVGDNLVIINDDDRVQTVGLFTVRPGETVDTPFPRPGVFKGACTMSASGEITITVT